MAFGPFELHPAEQRLLRDGRPLALNGRPFEVLTVLVARGGRLVDKDAVLDAVWGHRHVSESVLKGAVNTLRAVLGDDARAPQYVETVPRRGYRFIGALRPVAARGEAPDGAPAAQAAPAAPTAPAPETAVAPEAAPAAAATQAASPLPGNLPADAGQGLLGRSAELASLAALQREHRLITLTGLGGVGKTCLALALAAQDPPADGVWLLRLDDLAQPEQLLPTLAGLLRLGAGAATEREALCRALQASSMRLVLDNAEHLVDAVAQLVAALLAAAPRLRILVTSQLPLRVQGEQVHTLAPLALPADPGDDAPPPQAYAAAQLFTARVRQLVQGWAPQPAEHADIAALCRALDGVPLAIELAASRVPLLGVAGVRQRLDQRFVLLTRGTRDGAARHRTLAAALDWTFNLLSAAEQDALQRLAVFAGSFTAAAAEAVLPPGSFRDPAPLDLVDALRERSLLTVEAATGAAGAPTQPPRLRLYDSVRRYALSRLSDAGNEDVARRQHLRWALQHFADAEEREFAQPQLQWLPPLRADTDSLRAALRFGLEQADADPELRDMAQRLFAASACFWIRSGLRREGLAWLQRAQALPARTETALLLDHTQLLLVAYLAMGDLKAALAAGRRACTHWVDRGDHRRAFLNLHAQTLLMLRVEPTADRRPLIEQMRAQMQPGWNAMQERYVRITLGVLMRDAGDIDGYLEQCTQSARALRHLGATAEAWPNDMGQAQALALLGRLDDACEGLLRSVEEMRANGALREQAPQLAMNAALHLWRGHASAKPLAREAVLVLQAEGMLWWMADALAWTAWHDGRARDAMRLQAWADALAQARGDSRGPVFARMRSQLIDACVQAGHLESAARWHRGDLAALAVEPPRSEDEAIALALAPSPALTLTPAAR